MTENLPQQYAQTQPAADERAEWTEKWRPVAWISGAHAGTYYEDTKTFEGRLGHPADCPGCLRWIEFCEDYQGEPNAKPIDDGK